MDDKIIILCASKNGIRYFVEYDECKHDVVEVIGADFIIEDFNRVTFRDISKCFMEDFDLDKKIVELINWRDVYESQK